MGIIKSCGVLVYRGAPIESFLLMKHPRRFDLPKGHVDPGESDVECALRELREETGIAATDVALDPRFRFTTNYRVCSKRHGGEWLDKTLVVFLGRLLRPVEIRPTEHPEFTWLPWAPPHQIQRDTIDPLLASVDEYLRSKQPA